ncbi:MAG: PsiF family protein [Desulfovibrionaceae bacterium]|nr:PsiF family protein [Desulfovibrionaceae bacterium]
MNNKLLSAIAIGVCLSFGAAHAASQNPNSTHSQRAACAKKAGDRQGAERKAFIKQCMGANSAARHNKKKTCSAEAKTKKLKGAERKAFMKKCVNK